MRIRKQWLREKKGSEPGREVEVPAYAAINTSVRLRERVLEILMANVSTRDYARVIRQPFARTRRAHHARHRERLPGLRCARGDTQKQLTAGHGLLPGNGRIRDCRDCWAAEPGF